MQPRWRFLVESAVFQDSRRASTFRKSRFFVSVPLGREYGPSSLLSISLCKLPVEVWKHGGARCEYGTSTVVLVVLARWKHWILDSWPVKSIFNWCSFCESKRPPLKKSTNDSSVRNDAQKVRGIKRASRRLSWDQNTLRWLVGQTNRIDLD